MEKFTKVARSVGFRLNDKRKIYQAAEEGDLAKLKDLVVKQKYDINQVDKSVGSVLHVACTAGYVETVQFLVENKAMLNQRDAQNRSPLMRAVQGQHGSCVHILLENRAKPNLVDIDGNTALHLTAKIASVKMARLLLQYDADIEVPNTDGLTPLGVAVRDNHLEMAEFLIQEEADVNTIDANKRSLLMMAAENGQVEMLLLLLQNEADVTLQDNKGLTAKHYAQKKKHNQCSFIICEYTKQNVRTSPTRQEQGKEGKTLSSAPQYNEVGLLGGPAMDMGECKEDFEDSSEALSLSGADSFNFSDDEDESLSIKNKSKPLNPTERFFSKTRGSSAQPNTSLSTAQSKPKHGTASSQEASLSIEFSNWDSDDEEELMDRELTTAKSVVEKHNQPMSQNPAKSKPKPGAAQSLSRPKGSASSNDRWLSPIPETQTLHGKMANYSFDPGSLSDSNNEEESVSCKPSGRESYEVKAVADEFSKWDADDEEKSMSRVPSDSTPDNKMEHASNELDWDSDLEEEAVAQEFATAKRAVEKQNEPMSQDQNKAMPKEVESEKPEMADVSMDEDFDDFSSQSKPAAEQQTEVAQLKIRLQQEQENCHEYTMMFNAVKDELKRTDDQLHSEIQERQRVELTLTKVKQEMMTLQSYMKQLEQDHNDRERALRLSESHLLEVNKTLTEQLEDVRREAKANSKREISKLRSSCKERVTLAEGRHKESATQAAELRDEVSKLKGKLKERDTDLRQLREDLADSPKRPSTGEISLEEEDNGDCEKLLTLKAVGILKEKLADREAQCVRAENRIKQLEVAAQKMEIKNCKLSEAAKQADKIEALQKEAHDARLDQEVNRNAELQKKINKLCAFAKAAKKKLHDQNMGGDCNPTTKSLKAELEAEASRCRELEKDNSDLREELSQSEDRFRAELQHKLDQVNLFLQNHVTDQSLLEQKIRELETAEQRSRSQRDLIESELKMYKSMHSEQLRKSRYVEQERSHFPTGRNTSLYGGSFASSPPNGGTPGSYPVTSYRLDDYYRKMQSELDRTKEFSSSSRFSPVGPSSGDATRRTTQQYRDVLNRNFHI